MGGTDVLVNLMPSHYKVRREWQMTERGGLYIGMFVYSGRVVIKASQKCDHEIEMNVIDASIPYTYRTMAILELSPA